MQDDVDQVLSAAGVTFTREARLDARDRPDFLTTSGLAIELKVAGGRSAVVRQLLRYAEHEEVTGILLVTSRSRHLGLPDLLGGKPAWEHHAVSL